MTDREQIWQCAKRDLMLAVSPGREDVFLWEHCRRVAENALRIAALPAVSSLRGLDLVALEAAALYHDAGWACQFREGTIQRCEILVRPTSDAQRERGAILLGESLRPYANNRTRETAINAVRRLNQRPLTAPEAQVLSDAENLDEIGNLALWGLLRRHAWEGKGVDEALRTWRSQRDFRFWEARINSSFHFDAVKRVAAERLERLDHLVQEIGRLHTGEDLASLTA